MHAGAGEAEESEFDEVVEIAALTAVVSTHFPVVAAQAGTRTP
jgi:hypothetical protein